MASCASTSTRLVVTTSCRVNRGMRTPNHPSTQLHLPGSASSNCRYHSFHTYPDESKFVSRALSRKIAPNTSLATRALSSEVNEVPLEQEGSSYKALLLSSAALAFSFGYVTSRSAGETGPSVSGSGTKFGRSGGGGPGKPYSSILSTRQSAEEDVRKLEEEAAQKPYTVSAGAVQGARWTMEDEYKVANGGRFAAVFDGHGGNDVSLILRERLYDEYCKWLSKKHWEERDDFHLEKSRTPSISSHVAALRGAIEQVDKDVLKEEHLIHQGSTAVAVVVHVGEDGHRTLLSANVGDSRAILSRGGKAIDLTWDHKPNEERERSRIMARGEEVQWDAHAQVHRVRNLSLSRAIGDKFAKPAVSGEPEIRHFPVSDKDDEFFLLASDGLWDVMSSQEVVDYIHQTLKQEKISESLSEEERATLKRVQYTRMARKVAREALERGTSDNVCVLLVWLGEDAVNK